MKPLHLLVGIIFRDAATTLAAALDSVRASESAGVRVSVLLVDDASKDDWQSALDGRLGNANVHLRRIAVLSAAKARNFVLDEAERAFPDVDYICRLDADDLLAGPRVLAELARLLNRDRPDVLLAGNLQESDGVVLPVPNLASRDLLDPKLLLTRLERMSEGDPAAELPSCNAVVRRGLPVRYPLVSSGEDHWFTTALLLGPWHVVVAPELIYAVYRLRGGLTVRNRASEAYLASRRALLGFARESLSQRMLNGSS